MKEQEILRTDQDDRKHHEDDIGKQTNMWDWILLKRDGGKRIILQDSSSKAVLNYPLEAIKNIYVTEHNWSKIYWVYLQSILRMNRKSPKSLR